MDLLPLSIFRSACSMLDMLMKSPTKAWDGLTSSTKRGNWCNQSVRTVQSKLLLRAMVKCLSYITQRDKRVRLAQSVAALRRLVRISHLSRRSLSDRDHLHKSSIYEHSELKTHPSSPNILQSSHTKGPTVSVLFLHRRLQKVAHSRSSSLRMKLRLSQGS